MEINFRNDGNAYAVTGSGCNLPLIWCKGMLGESIDEEPTVIKERLVIPELIDFSKAYLHIKYHSFNGQKISLSLTFISYTIKKTQSLFMMS